MLPLKFRDRPRILPLTGLLSRSFSHFLPCRLAFVISPARSPLQQDHLECCPVPPAPTPAPTSPSPAPTGPTFKPTPRPSTAFPSRLPTPSPTAPSRKPTRSPTHYPSIGESGASTPPVPALDLRDLCGESDRARWSGALGRFELELRSCALYCAARLGIQARVRERVVLCVTECFSGGPPSGPRVNVTVYSAPCATCLGEYAACVAVDSGCSTGRGESPVCRSVSQSLCEPAFTTCAGKGLVIPALPSDSPPTDVTLMAGTAGGLSLSLVAAMGLVYWHRRRMVLQLKLAPRAAPQAQLPARLRSADIRALERLPEPRLDAAGRRMLQVRYSFSAEHDDELSARTLLWVLGSLAVWVWN